MPRVLQIQILFKLSLGLKFGENKCNYEVRFESDIKAFLDYKKCLPKFEKWKH